eukprot:TRINITY_DN5848_c1_g1_i1.p1 TRINITY_DN5848_c1_g1~~TRINITY_DN5848_c1_g1_i1.p1  ORF type:complete len:130 (-),score=6.11 TRINITY_DN5848_c1_g1_i1:227-616(-)
MNDINCYQSSEREKEKEKSIMWNAENCSKNKRVIRCGHQSSDKINVFFLSLIAKCHGVSGFACNYVTTRLGLGDWRRWRWMLGRCWDEWSSRTDEAEDRSTPLSDLDRLKHDEKKLSSSLASIVISSRC